MCAKFVVGLGEWPPEGSVDEQVIDGSDAQGVAKGFSALEGVEKVGGGSWTYDSRLVGE